MSTSRLRTSIGYSALASGALRAAGVLTVFLSQLIFARSTTVADYGFYVYLTGIITVVAAISTWGFDRSILRYVPVRHESKFRSTAAWVVTVGRRLTALTAVLLAIPLTVIAATEAESTLTSAGLMVGLLVITVTALTGTLVVEESHLRALGHVLRAQLPRAIIYPACSALMILGFLALDVEVSVFGLFFASSIGLGVAYLIARALAGESDMAASHHPRPALGRVLRNTVSAHVLSVFQFWMASSSVIILGVLGSKTDAALFGVAHRVSILVSFGLIALNFVSAPVLSRCLALGDQRELLRVYRFNCLAGGAYAVLILLMILAFGEWVLSLFGDAYNGAQGILVILAVGQLINAMAGPVLLIVTISEPVRVAAAITPLYFVLNLIMTVGMVGHFGKEGAAVAAALTLTLWNAGMLGVLWAKGVLRQGVPA